MLRKVGLLGVRLAAELANVRLQVLRVLVLWYVLQQGRFVGETLVAGVTFVRFVGLMATRVRLQVRELREGLGTARVSTFVRFVAGVRSYVLLQV